MKEMKILALALLMMVSAGSVMAQKTAKASKKHAKTMVKKVTTQTAQKADFIIEGSKGKLAATVQTPAMEVGAKVPMVIIMHGFTSNKDISMLTSLADSLQKRGIASIRFDFNGHGKSEGNFSDMTVPNEIEDAKAVIAYAKTLPYVGKIGVMGHSQGGVVASMVAGELGTGSIDAVALAAAAAVLREDAIRGNTQGAQYDPLDPPATVQVRPDYAIGRKYIQTAQSLQIYQTAQKYQGPAIIVHGTGDRVVPWSYAERYHEIWPSSDLEYIKGADHGFTKNQDEEVGLIANFMAKTLK